MLLLKHGFVSYINTNLSFSKNIIKKNKNMVF